MTDELKPCPYCGHEPDSRISDTDGNKYYTCGSKWCRNGNWYTLEEWNARSLEDALQKMSDKIAETEKAIDEFEEATRRMASAHYVKVTDTIFTQLIIELHDARNCLLELIKGAKNE